MTTTCPECGGSGYVPAGMEPLLAGLHVPCDSCDAHARIVQKERAKMEANAADKLTQRFPTPQSYSPGRPERAAADYLVAWAAKDWPRMFKATQHTWRHGRAEGHRTPEDLEAVFGRLAIAGAQIAGTERVRIEYYSEIIDVRPEIMVDVRTVLLLVHPIKGTETRTVLMRVVRESGPFAWTAKGQWGVNPISMLKGLRGLVDV